MSADSCSTPEEKAPMPVSAPGESLTLDPKTPRDNLRWALCALELVANGLRNRRQLQADDVEMQNLNSAKESVEVALRLIREAAHSERADITGLERALRESVKLQSHYTELLNMHDGGKRKTFTMETWLARLAELADEEPYFWLNGYRKRWRSTSHFSGKMVSYDDVVEWSGIDSDREVIRERVYTVTYKRPHGSERQDGSLAPGESVDFESGMIFNVTRTDKT